MRRLFAAGGMASLLLLLLALPASAADLTGGCRLDARSFIGDPPPTPDDVALDVGSVPGTDTSEGSQSNPFRVDYHGYIDFVFVTPTVFQDNRWDIRVEGIPVLVGRDDNPLDIDERGVVEVASANPLGMRIVGLFHVEGDLWGNDDADHCHGDGWVQLIGDPVGTMPWIAALALLGLGFFGLVATPYTRTWEIDPTGGEKLYSGPVPPPEA